MDKNRLEHCQIEDFWLVIAVVLETRIISNRLKTTVVACWCPDLSAGCRAATLKTRLGEDLISEYILRYVNDLWLRAKGT